MSRTTLLGPDVAFIGHDKAPEPFPTRSVPAMPDLAVEVQSPSNTMPELHRKAELYLQHGTALVWLVNPDEKTVEVWRRTAADETVTTRFGSDGVLTGEPALPGFTLDLGGLFLTRLSRQVAKSFEQMRYPLIAPTVRPLMICRCASSTRISAGIMATKDPAAISP